jgi:cardiolipin synthase
MTPKHAIPRQRRAAHLRTIPNFVSLVRPVCTVPFVLLCTQLQPPVAVWPGVHVLSLLILITSSDTLDGYLARRLGQESHLGRFLDHVCDVLFVVTSLGVFVSLGWVPWWLPAAIAWAFILYVTDSRWRTPGQSQYTLLSSRLGHLGGILYYVTVAMVTVGACLYPSLLSMRTLHGWFIGVALLALISGLERLMLLAGALNPRFPARLSAESLPRSVHSGP